MVHEIIIGQEAGEGAYRRDVNKRINQAGASTSPGTHNTFNILENVWDDYKRVVSTILLTRMAYGRHSTHGFVDGHYFAHWSVFCG